jgi:hypothetical protein
VTIGPTHHNTTPAVDKQLVLELKLRICNVELFDRLPSGLGRLQTCPMHQDVPDATTQLGVFDAVWCFQQAAGVAEAGSASWRAVDRERA